jgi:CheY-like chemotaxis protein
LGLRDESLRLTSGFRIFQISMVRITPRHAASQGSPPTTYFPVWNCPIARLGSPASNSGVTGMTTFLLVEDDPNDVLMLEMEFRRAPLPIRLIAVEDGDEATNYLKGKSPYEDRSKYPIPDVILLDLKMPRINGFEFLEWLRSMSDKHHRFIPVVVMSSSGMREDVDRAYALGANSYLVKPVEWNLFQARVQALGIYWAVHVEKL